MLSSSILKQKGFSLIELIIVVTIIGILSVAVFENFVDVRAQANISVLQRLKASLEDSASLIYNRAQLQDVARKELATVYLNESFENVTANKSVFIHYGYPQGVWSELLKTNELNIDEWYFENAITRTNNQPASVIIWTGQGSITQCHLIYQGAAQSGSRPKITINKAGC